MKKNDVSDEAVPVPDGHEAYDAPHVEQVILADDLARQIQYAGEITVVPV
jgi:hypothetical protein